MLSQKCFVFHLLAPELLFPQLVLSPQGFGIGLGAAAVQTALMGGQLCSEDSQALGGELREPVLVRGLQWP